MRFCLFIFFSWSLSTNPSAMLILLHCFVHFLNSEALSLFLLLWWQWFCIWVTVWTHSAFSARWQKLRGNCGRHRNGGMDGSWLVQFPDLIWRQLTPTVHISNSVSNLISDVSVSHIFNKDNKRVYWFSLNTRAFKMLYLKRENLWLSSAHF